MATWMKETGRLVLVLVAAAVTVAVVAASVASPAAFARKAGGHGGFSSKCKSVDRFEVAKKTGETVLYFRVKCVERGEPPFPEEPLPPGEELPPPGEEEPLPPEEGLPENCQALDKYKVKKNGKTIFVLEVRCVFPPGEGPPNGEF